MSNEITRNDKFYFLLNTILAAKPEAEFIIYINNNYNDGYMAKFDPVTKRFVSNSKIEQKILDVEYAINLFLDGIIDIGLGAALFKTRILLLQEIADSEVVR